MTGGERINEFLNDAKVFYLATVADGKPKNRPLGLQILKDDKIYFGVGDFKAVYKQMVANPYVEISATCGDKWLRFYGKAVFEEDYALGSAIVAGADFLKAIYNEETGKKLAMFHLEDAVAEIRDMIGNVLEEYKF